MGYGDDIMASAFAKIEKDKYPDRQIVIGDFKNKLATYTSIFNNNPHIADPKNLDPKKVVHFVNNHRLNRPYIDWKNSNENKYIWNFKFKAIPGNIFFSNEEIVIAKNIIQKGITFWNDNNNKKFKGIIFIETSNIKKNKEFWMYKHLNKDWGSDNWSKLIDILKKDYLIIQSVHKSSIKHRGVFEYNSDFREACAVLSLCDIFVGPEGGFGHAAAALTKPAVIIFGGWIHPQITGYDFHENIYIDLEKSPCGIRGYECDHCKECMRQITVEMVLKAISNNISKKINN